MVLSSSSLNPYVKYLQVVVDKVAMNTIAVELAFIGDIVMFSLSSHSFPMHLTDLGVDNYYLVDSPIYL